MPRVGRDAGVGRDADDHMMLMLMLMFMLLFMLLSIEKKVASVATSPDRRGISCACVHKRVRRPGARKQ